MAKKKVAVEDIAPAPLRCRGARNEDLKALYERLGASVGEEAEVAARELAKQAKAKTVSDLLRAAFAGEELELARQVDRASRPGCGADLRAEMAKGKLDGSVEKVTCPACGNVVSFRHVPAEE